MKKIIFTPDAPKPIGPYSQAVQTGNLLFISGQIAIDPATGALRTATIEEETHRVLDNISAILRAAGMDFSHVLKCTVFVADMHQFNAINAVYATYFTDGNPPARELVQVSALPRFVNIEISCIAAN
ncbi:MAG: RidA family protein [Saprospiraceae bacterium]|nr:RidA family protein [Saprospiraceae bacterium]